jgi:hypothetical protein
MECPRVRHPIFGEGIAIDQRHHGHEFLVQFPHSVQLWLRRSILTFLDASAPAEGEPFPVPRPSLSKEIAPPIPEDARSVIEAFRMGIVPARAIREWTVGREKEVDRVRQWLHDETSGTMVIRGEYGSGKSHLIEYLHASGFDLNYAVSLVGINPGDAQPGFPKRVYRHLIRNLRFPYQGQYHTLHEMLTAIGTSIERNPFPGHRFLGKILERIREERDTPELWEWIEGQETEFAEFGTLYDHTTAANIYCNILSGLGAFAVRALGLRGIILMFDEAETSRTYRYSYEWSRAVNFFNALSMVANDEPDLADEAVVKGATCYSGSKTSLIYSGHLRIPYVHQLPSFLKVVFAFTPDYTLYLARDYNIYEITLEPLPVYHLENLFQRFTGLYERVHRFEVPKGYRRRIFELAREASSYSTRRFIKAMVECLDFLRFHPGKHPAHMVAHESSAHESSRRSFPA